MSDLSKVRRKPVMVTLGDGIERQLKYTLNSFADMEEKYGSVDEALTKMEKGSLATVRYMIWAGLSHEEDCLTEKQVGALIDIVDLKELTEKMNKCMSQDLPDKDEDPNA